MRTTLGAAERTPGLREDAWGPAARVRHRRPGQVREWVEARLRAFSSVTRGHDRVQRAEPGTERCTGAAQLGVCPGSCIAIGPEHQTTPSADQRTGRPRRRPRSTSRRPRERSGRLRMIAPRRCCRSPRRSLRSATAPRSAQPPARTASSPWQARTCGAGPPAKEGAWPRPRARSRSTQAPAPPRPPRRAGTRARATQSTTVTSGLG